MDVEFKLTAKNDDTNEEFTLIGGGDDVMLEHKSSFIVLNGKRIFKMLESCWNDVLIV